MKKIIRISEKDLHNIICESIKEYLNEGVDFGKFSCEPYMALKLVKQKLTPAIKDGIIDPRALTVTDFGNVIYTKRLPAGVKINPMTFEITRTQRGGGKKNKTVMTREQYLEQYPGDEFVPLMFIGNKNNPKLTDEVRRIIAKRYSISKNGAILDCDRDTLVKPYVKGTDNTINFRARDINGNEIYHGNTTINALIKASFGNM